MIENSTFNVNKSNWKLIKLEDVAFEISDRLVNPNKSIYDKFVGLENFISGDIKINTWQSTKDLVSSAKIFKKGDVLFARRNVYLKRASLVNFDGCCSGDAFVLRENEELIINGFLVFILNSDQLWDFATANAAGTMSKRVKWRDLKEYRFLLPDKLTQKKICDLLNKFNELKENYNLIQNNLCNFLHSYINELFDTNKEKIKISDCIIKTEDSRKVAEGSSPYIEIGDVDLLDKSLKIKNKKSVKGSLLVKKNSILVSTVRPSRGAIVKLSEDRIVSSAFAILQANLKVVTSDFLFHCLAWNNSFLNFTSRFATGTTYPTITDEDIKKFKIPLLKISNQNIECKKLNEVYKQLKVCKKSLNEIVLLNKRIIYNFFK